MQKYYVDCVANTFSQYPVVRTIEKVVARNFKGVMFDEAEQRAKKLAGILNSRPTKRAADDCPQGGLHNFVVINYPSARYMVECSKCGHRR
jgi:hypothetical protein